MGLPTAHQEIYQQRRTSMKKAFTLNLLTVILIIALVLPILVNFVSAESSSGLIQITADGSVVGTSLIQRNENVYILTGNISGGIQVQKSNIVIEGAGYAVQGNGEGRGIDLSNGRGQDPSRPEVSNVTVRNLKILNFYYGVDNVNTHGNTFIGNYIENCVNSFWMGGYDNVITYNAMKNASIAINYAGRSNNITKNNFVDCWVMVWLSTEPFVDENWWSDYVTRYPGAKEIGNTGVWDTPYAYWENTVDNHPQMKPIVIPLYEKPSDTPVITINPDGSIEGTDKIQCQGNIYTFTSDIFGTITVRKAGIIIDGAGHTLQGNSRGINLVGHDETFNAYGNVLVKNLRIYNFAEGIYTPSNNNSFIGNFFDNARLHIIGGGGGGNLVKHNVFNSTEIFVDYNNGGNDVITENNFIESWVFVDLAKPPIVDRNYWNNYTANYPDAEEIGSSGTWDTPYVYDKFVGGSHGDDPCIDYHPLIEPVPNQWLSSEETLPSTENQQQEFPTSLIAVASGASAAIIGIGLFLHFNKRGRGQPS